MGILYANDVHVDAARRLLKLIRHGGKRRQRAASSRIWVAFWTTRYLQGLPCLGWSPALAGRLSCFVPHLSVLR